MKTKTHFILVYSILAVICSVLVTLSVMGPKPVVQEVPSELNINIPL